MRNPPADGSGRNIPDPDYITNWHGKPIDYLSRGELVDALDWCVKELRKHNSDYHHRSKEPAPDTLGEDGDQSGTHAGSRHKDNRRGDGEQV